MEAILEKPTTGGMLRVAVCPDAASYAQGNGCMTASAVVDGAIAQVRFSDITDPVVAVKVFHDVDADGRLRTNWIGWPTEPFGFSNDPPLCFGPPSFRSAAVALHDGKNDVRVILH